MTPAGDALTAPRAGPSRGGPRYRRRSPPPRRRRCLGWDGRRSVTEHHQVGEHPAPQASLALLLVVGVGRADRERPQRLQRGQPLVRVQHRPVRQLAGHQRRDPEQRRPGDHRTVRAPGHLDARVEVGALPIEQRAPFRSHTGEVGVTELAEEASLRHGDHAELGDAPDLVGSPPSFASSKPTPSTHASAGRSAAYRVSAAASSSRSATAAFERSQRRSSSPRALRCWWASWRPGTTGAPARS